MIRPRVDVDMDSIQVDLMTKVLERYNHSVAAPNGFKFAVMEDITEWDMAKQLTGGEVINGYFDEPDFFEDLPPLDGAVAGMRALVGLGYDVRIVSAATGHETVPLHKMRWIRRHLPEFDMKQVVFSHKKHEMTSPFMLIDDASHNLEARRAASPDTLLVTIDYPYNRKTSVDFRAMDYAHPRRAWDDIVDFAKHAILRS